MRTNLDSRETAQHFRGDAISLADGQLRFRESQHLQQKRRLRYRTVKFFQDCENWLAIRRISVILAKSNRIHETVTEGCYREPELLWEAQ
jgi:hypothetical protein